jgi:hypothetical protein
VRPSVFNGLLGGAVREGDACCDELGAYSRTRLADVCPTKARLGLAEVIMGAKTVSVGNATRISGGQKTAYPRGFAAEICARCWKFGCGLRGIAAGVVSILVPVTLRRGNSRLSGLGTGDQEPSKHECWPARDHRSHEFLQT